MSKDNSTDALQVVVFRAGESEFGADIRDVREIIKIDSFTSVPGSGDRVKGVINVRGEIVPLISLRSMSGAPPADLDKETRVLIVDQRPLFGMIVDSVGDVKKLPPGSIEPMPPAFGGANGSGLYTGIAKLKDRMIIIMDLKRTMASPERQAPSEPAPEAGVSEFQLDALRELGNIGTSHSATALSQLLGSPIEITVPAIRMVKIGDISSIVGETKVAGLLLEIREGDRPAGFLYNLFPEKSAYHIIDTLMGQPLGTTARIDEMGQSAIMEVSNILTSSFCDAIADFLEVTMLPTPPSFVFDMADSIIENTLVEISMVADEVIIFRTDMSDEKRDYEGYVVLFPNPETLGRIVGILEAKANP